MPKAFGRTLSATVALVVLPAVVVLADTYRVTVTRVDRDLYRVDSQRPAVYIETRYCYEFATRDDAVLRYERYGYSNKLIFSSGTACEVRSLR
jgi:hypothetical protein